MKLNYVRPLMPIILATNLCQPITPAQAIIPLKISTRIQVMSQSIHDSGTDSDRKGSAEILFFGRERIVSVSEQQEPLPPRPSPPGGSR